MLEEVKCTVCNKEHLDHYECSECGQRFGFVLPKGNYCCNCGSNFNKKVNKILPEERQYYWAIWKNEEEHFKYYNQFVIVYIFSKEEIRFEGNLQPITRVELMEKIRRPNGRRVGSNRTCS